jgi:hypothetical protein
LIDMEPNESVSRLLRLKRYEQPPPGYFEDFLAEFQCRQRAEVIQRPLWSIICDRASGFFALPVVSRFALATSVAVVALASALFVDPESEVALVAPTEFPSFSLAAAASSLTLPQISIRPEKPLGSVQYILPGRPISYVSSRSF